MRGNSVGRGDTQVNSAWFQGEVVWSDLAATHLLSDIIRASRGGSWIVLKKTFPVSFPQHFPVSSIENEFTKRREEELARN